MHIVLVHPPFDMNHDGFGIQSRGLRIGYFPPLGLGYIAAVLERGGHDVTIIDAEPRGIDRDGLIDGILAAKADVVGISLVTPTARASYRFAETLKERADPFVLVGGAHPTCFPREAVEACEAVDAAVIGEGEDVTAALVERLGAGEPIDDVPGIAFRDQRGAVGVNALPPRPPDLTRLPFPARRHFDLDHYVPMAFDVKRMPMASAVTSRGCTYGRCAFCHFAGGLGKVPFRRVSPERAVEEIEALIRHYGAKAVKFWDNTFTAPKDWTFAFCDLLEARKIDIDWVCCARTDEVSRALLARMAEVGLWSVQYGIESGNQELLDRVDKGVDLDQVRSAVRWTREAGIESRCSFMIGLPGETEAMGKKTIDFAVELNPEYAAFLPTFPMPGTALFDLCAGDGEILESSRKSSAFSLIETNYVPSGYSGPEAVERTVLKAYRRFYMRARFLGMHMGKIRSWKDVKYYMQGLRFFMGVRPG